MTLPVFMGRLSQIRNDTAAILVRKRHFLKIQTLLSVAIRVLVTRG